jgi:hypothetical protein
MKKTAILFIILFPILPAFPQKANQDKNQPSNKNQETKITPGASGVKRSIAYRFSSLLRADNPGDGTFRFNSGTIASVSYMIVADNDISGEDQTKWYSTWDDTTGAMARGQITIVESEGKNTAKFDVAGLFARGNGFWKIPVRYVSGAMPENGAVYYYVFERIDHKKDQAEKEPSKPDPNVIAEVVKPVEEVKPVEQPKPVEEVKPVEQPKPVEEVKPVEQPKPVEEVKPVEQPKPVEEVKPVEQPKPVEEVKPVEQPKPVEEVKPVEQPKPVEEVKPVEQPKPVEEVKPVEQPKPVEEVKPVEQPKPVEEVKPVEQPKPVEEVKPVEQPKQVEEAKPAEQSKPVTRRAESETVARKQTATDTQSTSQKTPTTGSQTTTQKSGTTFTTQVTQGSQPSQSGNAPPAYQSNLPTYQYRYSSGQRAHGKCYAGIIEVGYGLGLGKYGTDNFRFNFINGFHIGPTFTAGLGIGVRRYYFEHEKFTELSPVSGKIQIPVFLDLRKTFSTNTVTPYLALGVGNSIRFDANSNSEENVKEGLLFNGSLGIWFNISARFAIFCGAAYESQKMEYVLLSDDSHFKKNGNSVSLNIGIAF